MKNTTSFLLSIAALACVALPVSARAEEAAAAAPTKAAANLPFSEDQRGAMEDFVRNFILENPEVLMESVNRYRQKQEAAQDEDLLKVLEQESDFVYKGGHPEAGNPKGDVTVVEFFDYNCGYCKRAHGAIAEVMEKDKNVRFIFLEFPILSPQSRVAAEWSLAAAKQGKYWEFHNELMTSPAPKDEENLSKLAKTVGLDVEKLKKDAASEEVKVRLDKVKALAGKLNISGTPGFIVNKEIVRGYVPYDGFKTIIEDARKNEKK